MSPIVVSEGFRVNVHSHVANECEMSLTSIKGSNSVCSEPEQPSMPRVVEVLSETGGMHSVAGGDVLCLQENRAHHEDEHTRAELKAGEFIRIEKKESGGKLPQAEPVTVRLKKHAPTHRSPVDESRHVVPVNNLQNESGVNLVVPRNSPVVHRPVERQAIQAAGRDNWIVRMCNWFGSFFR